MPTQLATDFSALSLVVTTQRLLELTALTPGAPQVGAGVLDAALGALYAPQLGLLATVPAALPSAELLSGGASPLGSLAAQLGVANTLTAHPGTPRLAGHHLAGAAVALGWGAWVLESTEALLAALEVFGLGLCVAVAAARGSAWLRPQVGYDDVATLGQHRGLSVAELACLSTLLLGLVAFDVFVTLAEDDALEAISYAFGCVIALGVLLLLLAVDVQYYYMVSAVSGGEATLRLVYADLVNNGLCLLRVLFC
jgi:hypothetical protein